MKIIAIVIICFILSCSSSTFEEEVNNCISSNFSQVDVDYEQILQSIETDLIANNIISDTDESRISQLRNVAKNGEIKEGRTFENILWEYMGKRTIDYCVKLHTYSKKDCVPSGLFKMFKELDHLSLMNNKPVDLNNLRKEIAVIILRYSADIPPTLLKMIHLDYLYRLSETKEMKILPKLLDPDFNPDTSNTVNLHVGADEKILLEAVEISKEQLCLQLSKHLQEKKGVYFTNEKSTSYEFYLETFNAIKNCVSTLRNEESMERYDKPFASLSDEDKIYIEELIPLRIIETKPQ